MGAVSQVEIRTHSFHEFAGQGGTFRTQYDYTVGETAEEKSHEWIDLPDRPDRGHHGHPFVLWAAVRIFNMTFEVVSPLDEDMVPLEEEDWFLQWTPVVAGAVGAAALSFILLMFGSALGLGVSSTSPTWRDASAALAILSGIYLILQALVSFGFGGYIAGRTRVRFDDTGTKFDAAGREDVENRDGFHGLMAWAVAVLLGGALAALVGAATVSRSSTPAFNANVSAAEPLLSFELDRLFRSPRRPPNVDMSSARAEAGRILLTSSGHNGVSSDDRTYLVQLVAATTGLAAADTERRVDNAIADSKTAIARSRRNTIILAFSLASATLIGAVAAWLAACAGGRHRDGAPLPEWMTHANRFERRRLIP
jgi:hypothetical protein